MRQNERIKLIRELLELEERKQHITLIKKEVESPYFVGGVISFHIESNSFTLNEMRVKDFKFNVNRMVSYLASELGYIQNEIDKVNEQLNGGD